MRYDYVVVNLKKLLFEIECNEKIFSEPEKFKSAIKEAVKLTKKQGKHKKVKPDDL